MLAKSLTRSYGRKKRGTITKYRLDRALVTWLLVSMQLIPLAKYVIEKIEKTQVRLFIITVIRRSIL